MVTQILSPSDPKNVSDLILLSIHFSMLSLLWTLPTSWKVPVLGFMFVFWRLSYNLGIGYLLRKQSKHQTLTRWAKKSTLFGSATETTRPKLRAFIKSELEKKIPRDYSFDTAPLEYNTWLIFRRLVDISLSCDFSSYIIFAAACGGRPASEMIVATVMRWVIGLTLLGFSLWVKVDAHRVVKDFAWYYGDFFFLVDTDLTFDGVFEMAPHPMYSIGYVWYAGTAILAASNTVLFMSIFAWLAQCAFLVFVESPHIEKTYSSPPKKQQPQSVLISSEQPKLSRVDTSASFTKPLETHTSFRPDLYRAADTSTILIQVLLFLLTIVTPKTESYRIVFIASAVVCRIWFSIGIGYLLDRQSNKKKWTRHFLKHAESTNEAWRQWKGTYLVSMLMCYSTFGAAAWKYYVPPSGLDDSIAILKHTVGLSLIALQIWVATSIYDQLGEFGFFFGDFFFDFAPKLTYDGIYRYLNNPERVLGLAGLWGTVLITSSRAIFCLALFSHALTLLHIEYVERPHMIKLYGKHLRQDSGLVRSLKRSLPPPLRQWRDALDRVLADAMDKIEDALDAAKPQLEASITNLISSNKTIYHQYSDTSPTSRTHNEKYRLEIIGEAESGPGVDSVLRLVYGSPIRLRWFAPVNHAKRDWVGLYSLASRNTSREVTQVSSQGRWIATNIGEFDDATSEQGLVSSDMTVTGEDTELVTGEMVFSGDKLWWEQGLFEFRYHSNGKHTVMAISQPFEIQIARLYEEDLQLVESSGENIMNLRGEEIVRRAIEKALLPVVRNCFDRDPAYAPDTPYEIFSGQVERDGKYARRVVYAIQNMFGIELAPQVVKADGQVSNLAWRILEAQKVLQPYSMSKSRGTSTPSE